MCPSESLTRRQLLILQQQQVYIGWIFSFGKLVASLPGVLLFVHCCCLSQSMKQIKCNFKLKFLLVWDLMQTFVVLWFYRQVSVLEVPLEAEIMLCTCTHCTIQNLDLFLKFSVVCFSTFYTEKLTVSGVVSFQASDQHSKYS